MIPLEWISDDNLISALRHGVELDIEALCAMLKDSARLDVHEDARAAIPAGALQEYETTLMKILVHAWPLPLDPVVMAMRECAKTGLACARPVAAGQRLGACGSSARMALPR